MTNEQTIDAIMDAVLASQDSAFRRGDGLEGYEESVAADQCVRDMLTAALAAKDAEIAELKQRLADSMRDLQAPTPAPGEWVEWNGGECPIADGVRHQVQFRDGELSHICNDASSLVMAPFKRGFGYHRLPGHPMTAKHEFGEWVEWRGGRRPPIPDGVKHQVRLRNLHELTANSLASALAWDHQRSARDIVAYRIAI